MNKFTIEQVKSHCTTKSLWFIVNNNVYDLTSFMFDHPGGEELLLQHAGQDITNTLKQELHFHSDTAYELLQDYCIGSVDTINHSQEPTTLIGRRSSKFIDIEKPMLSQVFFGNYDKDFYVEQVHIPRHTVSSPPIFGNPILESLTKCYWWAIPIFWSPVIIFALYRSLFHISLPTAFICVIFGLFNWTLIEYSLHRFLFHLDSYLPNNRYFITLHFLAHGVHHFIPMDKMRLVMPPALGVILSLPIWTMFCSVYPIGFGDAIASGAYCGFVIYDLMHYWMHHGKAVGYLKEIKSYHLDHHYKNSNQGYGVTSKFWDLVFGTELY